MWSGFGRVGQGIKKSGKPRPQGQPGLAWPQFAGAKIEKEKHKNINGLHGLDRPRLAGVKAGKAWQGKAEKFGLQLACTGRGWWGQKLVKRAKKP